MKYEFIINYALALEKLLKPYCKRIEIAGSIRRKSEDCKDIEIVCIPDKYRLELFLRDCKNRYKITYKKNGALYKQFRWSGFTVDLFTATVNNWGWILFMRTGSSKWNIKALNYYRKLYKFPNTRDTDGTYLVKASHNGFLLDIKGNRINTPEENDVFDILQIPFTEPKHRNRK